MRRLELSTIGIVALWVVVILLLLAEGRISKAQDTIAPSICRDTSYPTLRFEFHLPADWLQVGSDVAWTYEAAGVASTERDGVWVADALEIETDGYAVGTVAIVRYDDNPLVLIGDENTAPCESAPVPTPEPTQAPVVQQAVSQAVVSTGRICAIQYPKVILVCS